MITSSSHFRVIGGFTGPLTSRFRKISQGKHKLVQTSTIIFILSIYKLFYSIFLSKRIYTK